jgi:hypothetical protein
LFALSIIVLRIQRPELCVVGEQDPVRAQRQERGGALGITRDDGRESTAMMAQKCGDLVSTLRIAARGIQK